MVAILKLIPLIFQVGLKLLDLFLERDKERKRKKKEALGEVKEGIKRRDPSRVTAGLDRINNIR